MTISTSSFWGILISLDTFLQISDVCISWGTKCSSSLQFCNLFAATGYGTERILITEYFQRGSLKDFLEYNAIDPPTLVRPNQNISRNKPLQLWFNFQIQMTQSLVTGLEYLHMEYKAKDTKPALAHRHIKSTNIFVKDNLTCCIGDLGMAVKVK